MNTNNLSIDEMWDLEPYCLDHKQKNELMSLYLADLTLWHKKNNKFYDNITQAFQQDSANDFIGDRPYILARLFKQLDLMSVKKSEVVKVLTSSGTTSTAVSKIYLDKQTARYQSRALIKIMQSFIGKQRLPMLIIDREETTNSRDKLTARGAGIRGLLSLGRDPCYVLQSNYQLNMDKLIDFFTQQSGKPFIIFGFTFMVWNYFIKSLHLSCKPFDLSGAILIHSGGWKKMLESAVTNTVFKQTFVNQLGIKKVHNFYGMVEQVGSIFVECEQGVFHTPNFADILIRNEKTLRRQAIGKRGLIQVNSILPRSYPGHMILTEDIGKVHGVDQCTCGRKGQTFSVYGRIPQSEIRGCSDTHIIE